MSTHAVPSPAITIDVLKDLESTSDLAKLLSSNGGALFQLAPELAASAGKPVSEAAGKFALSLKLTASPQWTAGPVTFSLAPSAACTVTIAAQGEDWEAALDVNDPGHTTNLQLKPASGAAYINIDLDFDLAGSAGGSGTLDGLTVSGKVSGSRATTLTFCQPVPSTTETVAALKRAFSALVLPTSPDALVRMAAGSSCRIAFEAALNWQFDLSYGVAGFKLSAPSCGLLRKCFTVAQGKLQTPAADLQCGATASLRYTHSGHFGLIVARQDAATALLYLLRASADEATAGAAIQVGITAEASQVAVDTAGIQHTVQTITGSAALAASAGSAVNSGLNSLENAARDKLNGWIQERGGDAGLSLALARQVHRTALFHYSVDLADPAIARQSWNGLLTRNLKDARSVPGFRLLPGAGVGKQFQQAATLQFHFFNLYKYADVTNFFDNCAAELGADGAIRFLFDVGRENLVSTDTSAGSIRIHFSGRASEAAPDIMGPAAIDLNIEISGKGNPKSAAAMAGILAFLKEESLDPVIQAMRSFARNHPQGTLALLAILRSSAWGRLASSPYAGGKPPADQALDQANWNAIHAAALALMGQDAPFVAPWTYADWGVFNSYCNTGAAGSLPDRRGFGPATAVPSTFWKGTPREMSSYFLECTARAMNLFDDLQTLAADIAAVTTPEQWDGIRANLSRIVQGDVDLDYGKPVAAAILSRAAASGAEPRASTVEAPDRSRFTATLTIA